MLIVLLPLLLVFCAIPLVLCFSVQRVQKKPHLKRESNPGRSLYKYGLYHVGVKAAVDCKAV